MQTPLNDRFDPATRAIVAALEPFHLTQGEMVFLMTVLTRAALDALGPAAGHEVHLAALRALLDGRQVGTLADVCREGDLVAHGG